MVEDSPFGLQGRLFYTNDIKEGRCTPWTGSMSAG